MWLLFLILLTEPPEASVLANTQGNPVLFESRALCEEARKAQDKAIKDTLDVPYQLECHNAAPIAPQLRTKD